MDRQPRTAPEEVRPCGAAVDRSRRERAIVELAGRQHGVLTRAQLIDLGLGTAAIDSRLRAGRLHALQRGVYLVGPVAPPLAREMAAVLSCGAGTVLSHRTAAALWRLIPHPTRSGDIEVTVPGRDPGGRPGVRVHRARRLDRDETRRLRGIPATTPARTLLDIASLTSPSELERSVAEAHRRGLASARQVLRLVARHPTLRGVPTLRRIADGDRPPALTRSEAEKRFLALVREAELPTPEVNVSLHGLEVDFLWRDQRLVVEIDGFRYHADSRAFEADRRRDARLAAHGYRVIRVTWRQLVDSPSALLARVAQALARGE